MRSSAALLPLAVLGWSARAAAEPPPGSDLEVDPLPVEEERAPPEKASPAPYSLPWHLRGALAATVMRSETTVARQDAGTTVVSFVFASLKVAQAAAVGVRYGWVYDARNGEAATGALTNTALAFTYAPALSPAVRFAVSGGVVLPTAQGGGGAPDGPARRAIVSGAYARSGMDNGMFAPNDLGMFAGASLAYIEDGWTLQLEATLFELIRVKGEARQVDEVKTNSTWGLHAGYFVVPWLAVSAELRYQDFIVPPRAALNDARRRDAVTAAVGLRGHVSVGSHAFRPGVAYAHPLDDPMDGAGYRIVQVDLPFVF